MEYHKIRIQSDSKKNNYYMLGKNNFKREKLKDKEKVMQCYDGSWRLKTII